MFKDGLTKINVQILDDSGSIASSRFDYQLACSLATLLAFSNKNDDVLLLVEKIDDFVIVENEGKDDEVVYFYQVKTKSGHPFTINAIIKEEFLLKQARNYVEFGQNNVKNIFMTNVGVTINKKLIDSIEMVKINDLEESDDKDKILNVIKGAIKDFGKIDDFYLVRSYLSLDCFDTYLKGAFHNYLDVCGYNELNQDSFRTVYSIIFDSLIKKRDYVLSDFEKTDFNSIIEKKGISNQQIKTIIEITKTIEIPTKTDISHFPYFDSLDFGSENQFTFLTNYDNFRKEAPKRGNTILKECRRCIDENIAYLDSSLDIKEYSNNLLTLFENDRIIYDDDFFKTFKTCIVIMFVFKKYND